MSAIITDQFRILNANNFIESFDNPNNSYYIFLSLPNPTAVGFGRTSNWDDNPLNPIDSFNYKNHVSDNILFGKRITSANVRRLIRRIDWQQNTVYEMYRHDYDINNLSPISQASTLYNSRYYVMNSDYRVYICIDNGSSGINTTGNASQDEPSFVDLEPSKAGESGDGYIWKYLFTVSPSDIVKFDSTEYITLPNNWDNSTDNQIRSVRDGGDSTINENQIKKVYIDRQGQKYNDGLGQEVQIVGDGEGAKVILDIIGGKIVDAVVSSGGKNYTYGMVDLDSRGLNEDVVPSNAAKLIPIIPPSKGHGYDLYKELGADRVLLYARFDSSTKDFPTDTKFAQIGLLKNPTSIGSTFVYTENQFSGTYAIKFSSVNDTPLNVGDVIKQSVTGGTALGYVVSYDKETQVVKYIKDRSLYFNQSSLDQTDYIGVSTNAKAYDFESFQNSATEVITDSGFLGSIHYQFSGITTTMQNKVINLGTVFNYGLSSPEINKSSGDILYLDNRPLISRNIRQKEDIKIILEF